MVLLWLKLKDLILSSGCVVRSALRIPYSALGTDGTL